MYIDPKLVKKIVKSVVNEYYPSNNGYRLSENEEISEWHSRKFNVGIFIPDNDYLADALTADMKLVDLGDIMTKRFEELGYDDIGFAVKKLDGIREYQIKHMEQLAMGC